MNSLVPEMYDAIEVTYPDGYTEVYTYKYKTVAVGTVTVVYDDLAKTILTSVTKT